MGETICSRCGEIKKLSEMSCDRVVNGVQRYRSYCKACRQKEYREKRYGKDIPWKDRVSKIKTRAKSRGIECTIEAEDLEKAWNLQEGRCVYTQEHMLIAAGQRNHPHGVSVDRVDPDRGYVPGNIVLCTKRANSIKQDMTPEEFQEWMPFWYIRLQKLALRSANARNN